VSLEIICKPSIKPLPEFGSIYMPEDLVPVQMPLLDSRAVVLEQKGVAGQPSVVGLAKDSGAAISKLGPTASQPDKAGMLMDPRAADPLVDSVWEIPYWVDPLSNYFITGDLPQNEMEARRLH
jgi:hypothetical protein